MIFDDGTLTNLLTCHFASTLGPFLIPGDRLEPVLHVFDMLTLFLILTCPRLVRFPGGWRVIRCLTDPVRLSPIPGFSLHWRRALKFISVLAVDESTSLALQSQFARPQSTP